MLKSLLENKTASKGQAVDQEREIQALKREVKRLTAEAKRVPDLKRQVRWLETVALHLFRRYRGFHMLAPPELCIHVGRLDNAANYWNQGLESSNEVLRVFGEDPGGPVLDWGCGVGRTLHWLRDRGTWPQHYRGCDVDPAGIAWLKSEGIEGVSVCGDLPPLPYADDSFVGLFCFSVLTHIPPARHPAWLKEIHRVLAPGGKAYITLNGALALERAGSMTEDERRVFAQTGGCYSVREGHYKDAAFASEAFIRDAMAGLFEIETYVPAGYHNMDVFIVVKR